jgi:hypothetical protein
MRPQLQPRKRSRRSVLVERDFAGNDDAALEVARKSPGYVSYRVESLRGEIKADEPVRGSLSFIVGVAILRAVSGDVANRRHIACGRFTLGGVDSKDSLLGTNQIQSCFWGGSLGCEEPFGFERCGVGADGAADYRPPRPEGVDRARQPYVR